MALDTPQPARASVVIAVKNGLPHIAEAVRSVLAQGQSLDRLIVVDDGSTDATFDELSKETDPRFALVRNTGTGVSSSRNLGAATCDTPWILFMDADDRLAPGALETLLSGITPGCVLVYGDYERIDKKGHAFGRRHLIRSHRNKPSGDVLEQLLCGNFLINGGVLVCSHHAFDMCGGFAPELSLCEDWHLWCRIASFGQVTYTRRHVLDYRVHDASVMMKVKRRFKDFSPALEAVFRDPCIVSRIPMPRQKELRRRGELSLKTYCAQQALRSGDYRRGALLTASAVAHMPRQTPYVLGRVAGAMIRL